MASKFKNILKELNILGNTNENSQLLNLTKTPPKEPKNITPHTTASKPFATEQADLLYLPDDNGYKYLLVVVDIATRLTDAEPLKSRSSLVVRNALKKIFQRQIVKQPKRIEVDAGSEFRDEFEKYWSKYLTVLRKIAGRHRQQSVVETKNQQIGKILNARMTAEEINNNEVSRSWVDVLPKVIMLINQHFSHPAKSPPPNAPIRTNKFTKDILPEGTPVRTQLDNPKSIDETKLHGKFRTGDIRWGKVDYITRFYLRPDQPPLYQVGNDPKVAYSRHQLQVVKDDEVKPPTTGQNKFIVREILEKIKKSNKIFYKVKWNDNSITEEPRTTLIKDIPDMIKQFEKQ